MVFDDLGPILDMSTISIDPYEGPEEVIGPADGGGNGDIWYDDDVIIDPVEE